MRRCRARSNTFTDHKCWQGRLGRKNPLKSFRELGISVVLVAIILCAVHYAVAREQLRKLDLDVLYQDVNRESFGRELPDVPVEWADLTDKYGVTTYNG